MVETPKAIARRKEGETLLLRKMRMEELPALVTYYPWYAIARKEICARIMEKDKDALTVQECSDAALYAPSRECVFDLLRGERKKPARKFAPAKPCITERPEPKEDAPQPYVSNYRGGGDYFSTSVYEQEKRADDSAISEMVRGIDPDAKPRDVITEDFTDFCTEPLAQIYLEQGYPEQAKDIYSKLSLRYPEKSAYFAALIEKIDKEI